MKYKSHFDCYRTQLNYLAIRADDLDAEEHLVALDLLCRLQCLWIDTTQENLDRVTSLIQQAHVACVDPTLRDLTNIPGVN
jgi:hypothetical protein